MVFKFLLCSCMLAAFLLEASLATPITENVVWFPDPKYANGDKLIPGYISDFKRDDSAPLADLSKIRFFLYTKDNPTNPDELFLDDSEALAKSHFIKNGQLKFMVHGFGGNIDHPFPWDTCGEFLKDPDFSADMNIILLDWHELAGNWHNPDYAGVVRNAYSVSNHSADFLEFLIVKEMATSLEKAHMIGFSLGGQIVGITGKRFQWRTGLTFPHVTSLDPAFPLFDVAEDDDRISPDDGDFVEVIHTAGGTMGMVEPRGHVDFYPNGGSKQPGCGVDIVGSCAHSRAPSFYKESIFGQTPFYACQCQDWAEFDGGNCACTTTANLGYWTDHEAKGKFYLRTNAEEPYAIGNVVV